MKKILLICCVLCFSIFSNAQEPLSFTEVIQTDSTLSKSDIYVAVKSWVGTSFNSAKAVIEMDDKDAGILIIRPLSDYAMKGIMYSCYSGHLRYTIKIQVRDGRFRVEVSNFTHNIDLGNAKNCALGLITNAEKCPIRGMNTGPNQKVWADIQKFAASIAKSYFSALAELKISPQGGNNDDDW